MFGGRARSSVPARRGSDLGTSGRVPSVVFYTRAGCHLCDDARGVVDAVLRRVAFALEVVDIDSDPELVARFGEEVPVVFVNGRKAFKYRVDAARLERLILEAAP